MAMGDGRGERPSRAPLRARSTRALAALACAAGLVALLATPASAGVPGPPGAPTATNPQPHPVARCPRASLACIDDTLRHMERLRRTLGCDHRAVFATTYLILTREIDEVLREQPRFFRHRAWMIYQDSLFANLYFRPVTEYVARRPVPAAWRIAFDVAARREANAGQDMLLGINAHIQRDMPFMLAELGLRTPGGTSRKPDHDRVNEVLRRAYEPVVRAIGSTYDPLITTTNSGWTPANNVGALELVRQWRETAWRNAERLLQARTAAERRAVALSIEQHAAGWARAIARPEQPGYREQRDAYCARRLPFADTAPSPSFALDLRAKPERVAANEPEAIRFRATVSATGWWHAPVAGATVRFAGRSARTGGGGWAGFRARLAPGDHRATGKRAGLRQGTASVRALVEGEDRREGAD
jgi:hypothetical protein